MASGVDFNIALGVEGEGAIQSAATKAADLADKLLGAKSAAEQAADGLKAAESGYARAAQAADAAAKSVERIGIAADAQRGKLQAAMDAGDGSGAERAAGRLQQLTARQGEAVAKANAARAALESQAAALDKMSAASKSAAANEQKLSEAEKAATAQLKSVTKEAEKAAKAAEGTGNARGIASGLGKIGGPIGAAGQAIFGLKGAYDKLGKSLGAAGPYAAAAAAIAVLVAASAVAAVGVAVVTAKIALWAIGNADAARSQQLLLDGIAGTTAGGKQLDATISKLIETVPTTREELSAMAADLAKGGLKGDALSAALETAAEKAARVKLGPEFRKELLSLTHQSYLLQDHLSGKGGIFSSLKIEPLLKGFSQIVGLFSATSESGNAIKVVFESIFQPLVNGGAASIPGVIGAFLQFEIALLKVAIYVRAHLSLITTLAEVFGAMALIVGGVVLVVFVAIAAGLAFTAITIAVVIAAVGALVAGLIYLAVVVAQAGHALVGELGAAFDWLRTLDISQIGGQIIDGLVNGIKSAGPKVLDALSGIANGAIDGVKAVLHIKSPSKVFEEIGGYTAEGMAVGVEKGGAGVQGALESMVAPPAATSGSGSSGSASGSGGGKSLAGATFNFYGVEGAEQAEGRFRALLTMSLEEINAILGGEVPAV